MKWYAPCSIKEICLNPFGPKLCHPQHSFSTTCPPQQSTIERLSKRGTEILQQATASGKFTLSAQLFMSIKNAANAGRKESLQSENPLAVWSVTKQHST